MEKKINIIALFGKAGAGKDTIQRLLIQHFENAQSIISNTTRPKRDYEKDGIDYHFLSVEDFAKKVLNGEMLEATNFNNWFYGTSIDSLSKDKINIGVFNPAGINCLWSDNRLNIIPIYIDASNKTRLLRQLNREKEPDCSEICRRFFTDEKDFQEENFDFKYKIYNNEEEKIDIKKIIDIIAEGLK